MSLGFFFEAQENVLILKDKIEVFGSNFQCLSQS